MRYNTLKPSISVRNIAHCPFIANAGFSNIDFGFASFEKRNEILMENYTDTTLKNYEFIKQNGLTISQTHLTFYPGHFKPLGNGTYEAFAEQMLPIFIKELEITAKMNCHHAVIHLYFEKDVDNSRKGNITLISKLMPYLEKHDITLCIENIYGPNFSPVHLSTSEELLFYTNYFNSNNVGICLDTGHAIILGQDPIALADTLGIKIKALHIHTTYHGFDRHLLPFSQDDKVDWYKFYNVLLSNGYSGTFNFETHCPKDINDKQKEEFYKIAYQQYLKIKNQTIDR